MKVFTINPRLDPRWGQFLIRHPRASIFHTAGWLEALYRTYGYDPVVYTTSSPEQVLTNGLVLCRVESWLTGRRLVSLPFSDHCEPLIDDPQVLDVLLRNLQTEQNLQKWKYLEIRPVSNILYNTPTDLRPNAYQHFYLYRIDLRPDPDTLYRSLHKDSIQRRISRAKREGLKYECGNSQELLERYYRLALLTRQRQGVPPQPFEWYMNLRRCIGDAMLIHLAFRERLPIAGIVTLRFQNTAYYKYGASDSRYKNLGATPFLLWRMIELAKTTGAQELDLGRTDVNNHGLVAFKEKWASTRCSLEYWKYPSAKAALGNDNRTAKLAKRICGFMPTPLLAMTGKYVYRHFA